MWRVNGHGQGGLSGFAAAAVIDRLCCAVASDPDPAIHSLSPTATNSQHDLSATPQGDLINDAIWRVCIL
jgi:hypothetical protein